MLPISSFDTLKNQIFAQPKASGTTIDGPIAGLPPIPSDALSLSAPAQAAPAAPSTPTPQALPTYTVQSGDTLSSIAAQQLGDAGRWSDIYNLNKGVLSNPNLILPGQSLTMPAGSPSAPAPTPAPVPARPAPAPQAPAATQATGAPASSIQVDPNVQPRDKSTISGYEKQVEQCGEFVYRYFKTEGKPYPTLGQPYTFLTTGKDQNGNTHPEYDRNMNGGTTPPKAGDILVAKGPKPGEYHTALITKVDANSVTVLQANVPYDWQGGKQTVQTFPLTVQNGKYTMPPLPTSKAGYNDDYPVTGWIHPTGDAALPGAPA